MSAFSNRNLLSGSARIFLSEALALPTLLVTAAFLSRQLGPEGYGFLVLAVTLGSWVEWSVTALFSRAMFKLISEQQDWKPMASLLLRMHLLLSTGSAAIFWLLSDHLAALLDVPQLSIYLQLIALEIPFFCLSRGYRNILVSIGRFKPRAMIGAFYWIMRLILIIALVWAGFSIAGAIAGLIGASVLELLFIRRMLPVPLWKRASIPLRTFWRYSLPLFGSASARRIYQRLDLFALKSLGGSTAQAGFYGAAHSVLMMSSVFMTALSPLLLSTVSNLLSRNQPQQAHRAATNAVRLAVALLPFAALFAGSVREIVVLVFSASFLPAYPVFRILVFGEMGAILISLTTAIMVAHGRPRWSLWLNGLLVIAAIPAYLIVVPTCGMTGAALVAAGGSGIGALAGLLAARRLSGFTFPWPTLWRSILISMAVFAISHFWVTTGWLLIGELSLLSVLIIGLLVLGGEISPREKLLLREKVNGLFAAIRG